MKYVNGDNLLYFWQKIKNKLLTKVDKVDGMGLSHNDLTDELKTKILSSGTGAYSDLTGKPSINGVELGVTNTLVSLGIQPTPKILGEDESSEEITDKQGDSRYLYEYTELAPGIYITSEPSRIVANQLSAVAPIGEDPAPEDYYDVDAGAYIIVADNGYLYPHAYILSSKGFAYFAADEISQSTGGTSEPTLSPASCYWIATLDDLTNFVTSSQVNTMIQNVVGAAPTALDTLKELADALGNDANFASTVTTALGNKVNTSDLVALTNAEIDTIVAS